MLSRENPLQQVTPRWTLRTSLVAEWFWAMLIRGGDRPNSPDQTDDEDDSHYPNRLARFAQAPGLEERIEKFWDDGCMQYIELVVLARRAGCLWELDRWRVLAGLRRVVDSGPGSETFDSETDETAAATQLRLQRLADEPTLAEEWLTLVAEVAGALADAWDAEGFLAAETAVHSMLALSARTSEWPNLAEARGCMLADQLPGLCQQTVAAGGEVVVAPSRLARKSFVLAFGDLVLVSWPAAPPAEPSETNKAVARSLSALGDPTRLAVVEQLAIRPRGVGQLARDLQVSQPTISNHVRLLRDIGLVTEIPNGRQRQLSVDVGTLDQILTDVRTVILGARAAATGGES